MLRHLEFHKFKHSFKDTLKPICSCSTPEATIQYLFHCRNFSNKRLLLFKKFQSISGNILIKGDSNIPNLIFIGVHSFSD